MAISYNNQITKYYHGRMGDVVFRNVGGRSVMSIRPDCSKVKASPAQLANQDRFSKAVRYGKCAKKNGVRYEYYRKRKKSHQSAYNAAISDFLIKPKVEAIDIGGYLGIEGNMIGIRVWDKDKAESVSVRIFNKMGQLLEKGDAVVKPSSGRREWEYKATVKNADYKTGKIMVQIKDLPGNVVEIEADTGGT